jgi:hypothetical protein
MFPHVIDNEVVYVPSRVAASVPPQEELALAGRACWDALFTSVLTEDNLANWEKTIPRYGCDCENFYKAWKRDNAPTFPLPFSWKYELKTAVNAKLGKPNLSFEEAFELYYGPV